MRLTHIIAVGLAMAAAPAVAQETEEEGFNGIYVGGSVGYGFQENDGRETVLFDTNGDGRFGDTVFTATGHDAFAPGFCGGAALGNNFNAGCNNDKDDIEYYGHVGADAHLSRNIVVGALVEFGKADVRDSVTAFSSTPASYTLSRSLRYNGSFRGRLGYTPNQSTLFYVTGGGAYGKIRNRFTTSNTANAFSNNGNSDEFGWTAGGGVEQKLGRNFSVGLNYLYTELNDDEYRVFVDRGTAGPTNPFILASPNGTDFRRSDREFSWHSIRVSGSFRF